MMDEHDYYMMIALPQMEFIKLTGVCGSCCVNLESFVIALINLHTKLTFQVDLPY